MLQTVKKIKKTVLTGLAVGTIGFAVYGGYNISQALAGIEQIKVAAGDAVISNPAEATGVNQDGNICNPYNCAGCGGCTSPQYQPVITMVDTAAVDSGQVYQ